MKPTKERDHAIVDLVDVLLREGAILQADVLVTVADVPLIGVNLRAAIAGMHTMREYGFFEDWDAVQRQYGLESARSSSSPGDPESTKPAGSTEPIETVEATEVAGSEAGSASESESEDADTDDSA